MKTLSAAATAPLVPMQIATALPVSATQYAKAIEAANVWAYLSVGNLKRALGVDETTSRLILQRLQSDGFLGHTGKSGIALTKKYALEQARIAAKAMHRVLPTKTPSKATGNIKTKVLEQLKDEDPSGSTPPYEPNLEEQSS